MKCVEKKFDKYFQIFFLPSFTVLMHFSISQSLGKITYELHMKGDFDNEWKTLMKTLVIEVSVETFEKEYKISVEWLFIA